MYVKPTPAVSVTDHSLNSLDEVGDRILEVSHGMGQQPVVPRRVGWFDSVVMRHSRRVSGITNLSLNSIDVLSGLDTVKICVAYDLDGERIDHYPASLEQLKRCKPIYEELPGWSEDITGVRHLDELPENARNYVRRVGGISWCAHFNLLSRTRS